MSLIFKSPETEDDWQRYYQLRWQVLREPWHQPLGSERDELENQAFHLMAVDNHHHIVGTGRLHRHSSTEAQIRYMAIQQQHQGQGIGRQLLQRLEQEAVRWGCREVLLNARVSSLEFYLHQSYQIVGEAPMLFGCIAHKRMHKSLAATSRLNQPIGSD
jgi:GNAT superfamily N-acetyltransferase